jgi:hypothetical protein
MYKEIITYFSMDLGDVDKTTYGLYNPETSKFHEISEEEYKALVKDSKDLLEYTGYLPLNIKPEWLNS